MSERRGEGTPIASLSEEEAKANGPSAAHLDPAHFECAVVRLVSMQPARNQRGQLFFASVSLLTRGRQRPPSSEGFHRQQVGRTDKRLYFRRTVLSVEGALDWYRGLNTEPGNVTPVPELQSERNATLDGVSLAVSTLVDRPVWPRLGIGLGRDLMVASGELAEPCPFVGSPASRVHRRFGAVAGFEEVLDDANCIQLLKRWIHFDLRQYPEYVGSAVLVVPDPYVRRIDSAFVSNPSGGEDEVLRIVPRSPGGLQDLCVTHFERQAHLLTQFDTRDVPAHGMVVMPSNESLGATGFILSHKVHGPLRAASATHYLRTIGVSVHVEEPSVEIEAPAGNSRTSATTSYQATRITSRRTIDVGGPSIRSVDIRIEEAALRRRQAFEATHYEQTWLEAGEREEALIFVRSRVHRARGTVLVADPYFGFLQIRQIMFAISHPGVKVTVLTSRLAFESPYAENPDSSPVSALKGGVPVSRVQELARLEALRNEVAELKTHIKADVNVRVLPGDPPELHDRFLVVDGTVWLVGGSFNALGGRASMVVRLPQSDRVVEGLAAMTSRALTLEDHIRLRTIAPGQAHTPNLPVSWWRRKLLNWLDALREVVQGPRQGASK